MIANIVAIVLVAIIVYFVFVEPIKKREAKHDLMVNNLELGDHVVMMSGLHGTVFDVSPRRHMVTLVCDHIFLMFDSGAIDRVEKRPRGDRK